MVHRGTGKSTELIRIKIWGQGAMVEGVGGGLHVDCKSGWSDGHRLSLAKMAIDSGSEKVRAAFGRGRLACLIGFEGV